MLKWSQSQQNKHGFVHPILGSVVFFPGVGGTGGQIPAKLPTDSYTTNTGMRASTWQTLPHKMCHHFHNFACNLE